MNEQNTDNTDIPNPRRISLRDIAAELRISHATVSNALRNKSGVSKEMKARVRAKADEMGYIPDPLLSSLSSYRTDSKVKPIQAALAWLNAWPQPEKLRQHKEFDLYWEGASYSARRLGYHLEVFNLAEIPPERLRTILKTRNIQGILIPPLRGPVKELERFDWSDFAVVRFGLAVPFPQTHFVTSAQMMNTMRAFQHVRQLGYQRIGFVCESRDIRFFELGYSWAQKKVPLEQRLPPLLLNSNDDDEKYQQALEEWLIETKPDALISDKSEILDMLKNIGYRIPDDLALATTSIHDTPIDAGIDQRSYEIGRAAIRILTSLIADRSFGVPESLNETLIEGKWVDGSMLPKKSTLSPATAPLDPF